MPTIGSGSLYTPITTSQSLTASTPAPDGAVGLNHIVAVANSRIAWFGKDGSAGDNLSFLEFFPDLQPPNTTSELPGGDPQVVYDIHENRFVVAVTETLGHLTDGSGDNLSRIHIAVSDDGDPNGAWHRTAIDVHTTGNQSGVFEDLPKLEVDSEAVYVAADARRFADHSLEGRMVWRLPKHDADGGIYDGGQSSATSINLSQFLNTSSVLPVEDPASGATLFVALDQYGAATPESMRIATADWSSGTAQVSSSVVSLGELWSDAQLPEVTQPDGAPNLTVPNLFPTSGAILDGVLSVAFTAPGTGADAGQQTARWAQFDVTNPSSPRLLDQGAIGGEELGEGTHTFLPAVAVNNRGDLAIAFQASGPSVAPGIYATAHENGSSSGLTLSPVALAPGQSGYQVAVGHWGDSSAAQIDPVDGTTIWGTNAFVTGATSWGEGVASFTVAPGVAVDLSDSNDNVRLDLGLYGSAFDQGIAGAGNDTVLGNGNWNVLIGNGGNDELWGVDGNDLLFGNLGSDLLLGNAGSDTLYGGQQSDTLYGGQDADLVFGNLEADVLFGNTNNDTLFGGQGSDTLYGGQGDDIMYGNLGNDYLAGGLGTDTMFGGADADTFRFRAGFGTDVVADFDASEGDVIQLDADINGSGISSGATAAAAATTDDAGNAVIQFGNGDTLILWGVPSSALSDGHFTFA